jgi:hypothetical protein
LNVFDFPGAAQTEASGINDVGQVVGSADPSPMLDGFLLSRGTYTVVHFPGSTGGIARAINFWGQIVGFYADSAGDIHGYVRK